MWTCPFFYLPFFLYENGQRSDGIRSSRSKELSHSAGRLGRLHGTRPWCVRRCCNKHSTGIVTPGQILDRRLARLSSPHWHNTVHPSPAGRSSCISLLPAMSIFPRMAFSGQGGHCKSILWTARCSSQALQVHSLDRGSIVFCVHGIAETRYRRRENKWKRIMAKLYISWDIHANITETILRCVF
jgi:hypothetical protein